MMRVVIYAYNEGIGGVEVVFAGFVKHCLKQGYNVCFITRNVSQNIYFELLKEQRNKIKWAYVENSRDVRYMTDNQRMRERENIFCQLNLNIDTETVVISFFYGDFLASKMLFDDVKYVKLYYLWSHPLDFMQNLRLINLGYDFVRHSNYRQYEYQKQLLQEMVEKGACSSHPLNIDLCNWYYGLNLPKQEYFALPIQFNVGGQYNYHYDVTCKRLNVLWVGRFDYFKNDAIDYIAKSLESVALAHPEYLLSFDIVGYGAEKYDKDIRNRLKKYTNIKIEFLGGVHPSNLNELFSHYDLGIAMGMTIKQMAYSGLPAVIIDSLDEEYNDGSICNWVFDSFLCDSGDGIYYYKIGKPLPYRVTLQSILDGIIANPDLLNINSEKCRKYVAENYDFEKQNTCILEAARKSRYFGSKTPVFMYAWYIRWLRSIWQLVKPMKRLLMNLRR